MSKHGFEPNQTPQPPRRRIGSSLMAAAVAASLAGCGSDDGGSAAPAPTTLKGTVAVGAALPGASIAVQDADASTADVTATALRPPSAVLLSLRSASRAHIGSQPSAITIQLKDMSTSITPIRSPIYIRYY